MIVLLLLLLAQPDCADRRPGLSQCVDYRPEVVDAGRIIRWRCLAVCYSPSGIKKDGGTDANTLTGHGADQPACKQDLEAQCAARQRR